VNHSGTFNGSVMAMAATVATLRSLRDAPPYAAVSAHGSALMEGIAALAVEYAVDLHIQGLPMAFHVSFGAQDALDYRGLRRLDLARYERLADRLVENGLWVARRGVWYVSAAHGQPELDEALRRFDASLRQEFGR